jgi:hypothetical protein
MDWRLAIALGLASASLAACLVYLMAPPWQVQAIRWPSTAVPPHVQERLDVDKVVRPQSEEEKAVAEFEAAADAILRKTPNTRASALTDVSPRAMRIPLPRPRPADAP